MGRVRNKGPIATITIRTRTLPNMAKTWVLAPTLSNITDLLRPTQLGKPEKKEETIFPTPYANSSLNIIFYLNKRFRFE